MQYLKAIYSAAVAGLGSAQLAYVTGHGHIGWYAGMTVAIMTITAFGAVAGVANAPKPAAADGSAPPAA